MKTTSSEKQVLKKQAYLLLLNNYLKEAKEISTNLLEHYPADYNTGEEAYNLMELNIRMRHIFCLYEMFDMGEDVNEKE